MRFYLIDARGFALAPGFRHIQTAHARAARFAGCGMVVAPAGASPGQHMRGALILTSPAR